MNKKDFINKKLNKDFYNDLPEMVCKILDDLIQKYGDRGWFIKAWNEYREYVNNSTMDSMKMPGHIFNKYIENGEDEIKHSLVFDEFTQEELFERLGEYIEHIGVGADDNPPGRGSGRYPKGSGKNPYQHETAPDFYNYVKQLEKKGLSEVEIADGLGISTTKLRAWYTMAKNDIRREKISYAKKAQEEGKSNIQIGIELGEKYNLDKSPIGESTVRSLLNGEAEARMNTSVKTAEELKKILEDKKTLDVGVGVEREIGITRTKLDVALEILQNEGYHVYNARVPQATNKGQFTTIKVLAKPDVEYKDIYNYSEIGHLNEYTSPDNGDHIFKFQYPKSMDSKRLMVRFDEDGGTDKDGLVEIRRGVKDLSLGESNYSQVRILVDDKYYIKGMAVYGNDEDFPEGVDVIFNSNKPKSKGKLGALKSVEENLKKDPENPFGSSIKEGVDYPGAFRHGGQSYYLGDDGKYHLSLINKRADEGDWDEWSKELPSQMLGKQPHKTIERQLNLAKMTKEEEFNQIMEVTNPTIKREMLIEYADKCDRAALDLKAAPFPGQKYQVILPLKTIKNGECYAPNYPDGSELALIRYPHGGTFEIPIVKVNNRNKEGKESITSGALDAIGINAETAHILSGADFDGYTVMVIPLQPDKFKIQSKDPLQGLKGFDPTVSYGPDKTWKDEKGIEHASRNGIEYPIMDERYKQIQMGVVSNLITDMTLAGASEDELAAAVRHSMVVIDASKHKLDYKQSEVDNNVKALHRKYQGHIEADGRYKEGAATILSRAKSPKDVLERKEGAFVANDTGNILTLIDEEKKLYLDEKTGVVYGQKEKHTATIDPETGKKLYRNTNVIYKNVEYKDSTGKKQKARIYEKDGEMFYKDKETGEFRKVSTEKITPVPAVTKSTKMAETDDARTLMSGNPGSRVQETLYADYANKMKSLANEARKESLVIEDTTYSPSAAKTYSEEVKDLKYQLNEALKNTPRERQAQMIAASELKIKVQEDPHMSEEEKTKLATRLLIKARANVGAERKEITISDKQWEAIQAGAINPTTLKQIFRFANKTRVRQLATPYKNKNSLSKNQINRMKSMSSKGYTNQEIAELLGISTSTVVKYLLGKE